MIAAVTLNEKNGPSRKRPFDRWFRYPAGFAPETLDRCFEAARIRRGELLVDPFAGVATTATSGIAHGVRFRGIEVHPLIADVGSLKLTRPDARISLVAAVKQIPN